MRDAVTGMQIGGTLGRNASYNAGQEKVCSCVRGRGDVISELMSTKAEYKERQADVQKSNVCSAFIDRPSNPLGRTFYLGMSASPPGGDVSFCSHNVRCWHLADMA